MKLHRTVAAMSPASLLLLASAATALALASFGVAQIPDGPDRTAANDRDDSQEGSYAIIGGEDAPIYDFRYQAAIELNGTEQYCGGAIISRFWVLTGAQCLNDLGANGPSTLSVRVSATRRQLGGQLHPCLEQYRHPKYVSSALDYDVALLRVAVPFPQKRNADPIALPKSGWGPPLLSSAVVSGWGATNDSAEGKTIFHSDILKKLEVQIVSRAACNEVYLGLITDRMLCAIAKEDRSPCIFDTGGPLVGSGFLIGIVSWSYECGNSKFPYVYTLVSNPEVRSFIAETLANDTIGTMVEEEFET